MYFTLFLAFEEALVSLKNMEERIIARRKHLPWLVYEENGVILGYAHASPWKGRAAYRQTVEATIYLKQGKGGKGIGTRLYQQLLTTLTGQRIHTVIGGIALPNPVSIKLHEKLGFEKVAHFKEVGYKFGKWLDVGYWQWKRNL